MSLSSFLAGAPLDYAAGYTQTSGSLPDWYNSYQQAILENAAQFAAQGSPNYQGPRVAALSPLQTNAASTVQGMTGVGSGIAQQGVGQVNKALGQPNAITAANPYLKAAGSPLASAMQQFQNPYTQQVINATDALSARNFNQNVLPGLQDEFTRAGQVYGGSRQGYGAALLGSQEQQNEAALNAQLESQGFNTALGGAEAQAGINAGLAGTAASAANAAQNTGIAGGATLGSLGTTVQNNGLDQALVQNQFGQQAQANTQQNLNTGYNDYLQQFYNPLVASQAMQGALSGMQVPTGTTTYNYQPFKLGYSPLQNAVGTGTQVSKLINGLTDGFSTGTQNGGYSGGAAGYAARGGRIRYASGGRLEIDQLARKYKLVPFRRVPFRQAQRG